MHTASARADGFANADAEARSPDCCCPSHRPRVATALAQIEIGAKFGYFPCMRWPLALSRVAPNYSALQSRCRLGGSAQHDDEVSALKTELARLRGALHICAVTGACMLLARLGSCARRRRCEAAQVAGKVGPLATTPHAAAIADAITSQEAHTRFVLLRFVCMCADRARAAARQLRRHSALQRPQLIAVGIAGRECQWRIGGRGAGAARVQGVDGNAALRGNKSVFLSSRTHCAHYCAFQRRSMQCCAVASRDGR